MMTALRKSILDSQTLTKIVSVKQKVNLLDIPAKMLIENETKLS
jgi:hypothetical protein